jgi:hypothetical protein
MCELRIPVGREAAADEQQQPTALLTLRKQLTLRSIVMHFALNTRKQTPFITQYATYAAAAVL